MVSLAAEPSAQNYAESVSAESIAEGNEMLQAYKDKYCRVIGDAVCLRRDAGFDGEKIGHCYKKDDPWVRTTGEYVRKDGETWMRVSDSSLGQAGWVAKRYIRYKN